jgi:hypothetical protein
VNRWRNELLVLLLVGWALVFLLWHMQDVWERTAKCELIGTEEACCPKGGCKFYPASQP